MPRFTLIVRYGEDPEEHRHAVDVIGREAAGDMGVQLLEASTADAGSVAVALGEGDDLDWLGVYDWERGRPAVWSPDD